MPLIEVESLRKQYDPPRGTVAVDGISFHVDEGEIYSLIGPNGAGKTTTISMLCCLVRPTSGDARVGGYSVTRQPAQVKRLIGVVPQDIALYPDLTARENLLFWGRMYGLRGAELKRRVDEILELIGLTDRQKERLEKYSGGMKRRVNIGVALLHRPPVLFLDEPTVGIDPQSRRAILDAILEFRKQGMTVLYTTHYIAEAEELSDRVGIMDHGKMIAEGTYRDLVTMVDQETRIEIGIDRNMQILLPVWATIPGVRAVFQENGQAVVLVREAARTLPTLLETAMQHGARVTRVTLTEPDLETVFLHLTGRALRD